jgi:hypothetical protein
MDADTTQTLVDHAGNPKIARGDYSEIGQEPMRNTELISACAANVPF